MPIDNKLILKQAQEAMDRAIREAQRKNNEESRKFIVASIGKDLVNILKPLLEKIAKNSKLNKEELTSILKEIKLTTTPEVKVSSPEVRVPEIKLPTINVPETKVIVKPTDLKLPKDLEIKGFENFKREFIKAINQKLAVVLKDIDRDHPIPMILVDEDGNYIIPKGGTTILGQSGASKIIEEVKKTTIGGYSKVGDGNVAVALAGTAVQLSSVSISCKRVIVHAVNGHIVVGGSDAKYAAASRKGVWLSKTQRETFLPDNVNKLWVDAAANGILASYHYEN